MIEKPTCLECAAELEPYADSMPGEIITCPDCGESYEIVSLEPFKIRKAEQEAEDWGQ